MVTPPLVLRKLFVCLLLPFYFVFDLICLLVRKAATKSTEEVEIKDMPRNRVSLSMKSSIPTDDDDSMESLMGMSIHTAIEMEIDVQSAKSMVMDETREENGIFTSTLNYFKSIIGYTNSTRSSSTESLEILSSITDNETGEASKQPADMIDYILVGRHENRSQDESEDDGSQEASDDLSLRMTTPFETTKGNSLMEISTHTAIEMETDGNTDTLDSEDGVIANTLTYVKSFMGYSESSEKSESVESINKVSYIISEESEEGSTDEKPADMLDYVIGEQQENRLSKNRSEDVDSGDVSDNMGTAASQVTNGNHLMEMSTHMAIEMETVDHSIDSDTSIDGGDSGVFTITYHYVKSFMGYTESPKRSDSTESMELVSVDKESGEASIIEKPVDMLDYIIGKTYENRVSKSDWKNDGSTDSMKSYDIIEE